MKLLKWMPRMNLSAVAFVLVLVPVFAFADAPAPVTEAEFWAALWQTVGGLKGLSAMGIAYALVQLMIKFLSSPLGNFTGNAKMLIIGGLNVGAVLLASLVAGVPLINAISNGAFLTIFAEYAFQIWKRFVTKETV